MVTQRLSIPTRPVRRLSRRAFTLIEAMMVTVIIGVGVMAMHQLLAAGTMVNSESTELTTAVNLANNINELAIRTPYNDLRTVVGTGTGRTYSPPIDGMGADMTELNGQWVQVVTVKYVSPTNLTFTVPDTQIEPTSQITVKVLRNNKQVHQTSWIVARGS
jgi:prepilin-type N-terminal cleavage/methylation domain-containing protein